jgi:thiamine pyrophosphokinase
MKYEHYTPEAVILANGEYPGHPLPLQCWKMQNL